MSFGISTPGVSIGFNVPTYPQLVRVPGYPVYYAPGLNANYFFYDGMYWVYQGDNWYTSSWYNGPWNLVAPDYVPAYVLRVPVRYYRAPPVYFRGWRADAPPRWGDHWGGGWAQAHAVGTNGTAGRLPRPRRCRRTSDSTRVIAIRSNEQQYSLNNQHYRYQPQDPNVRQHYQQQGAQRRARSRRIRRARRSRRRVIRRQSADPRR